MTGRSSNSHPLDLLQEGAAILGVRLPSPALEQFRIYLEELRRWNARVNLTGLKTERDIILKHFLDSLAVLPFLGDAASLADLGSGAGFPGLALKLVRPEMALTLVEARAKKAAFLEYLASLLKLEGVKVAPVHLTPALARSWGPRFETVASRAAFPLSRFLELAAPLLLPGGRVLGLKGPNLAAGEMDAAREKCTSLGLGSLELHRYDLPFGEEARILVLTRHF